MRAHEPLPVSEKGAPRKSRPPKAKWDRPAYRQAGEWRRANRRFQNTVSATIKQIRGRLSAPDALLRKWAVEEVPRDQVPADTGAPTRSIRPQIISGQAQVAGTHDLVGGGGRRWSRMSCCRPGVGPWPRRRPLRRFPRRRGSSYAFPRPALAATQRWERGPASTWTSRPWPRRACLTAPRRLSSWFSGIAGQHKTRRTCSLRGPCRPRQSPFASDHYLLNR